MDFGGLCYLLLLAAQPNTIVMIITSLDRLVELDQRSLLGEPVPREEKRELTNVILQQIGRDPTISAAISRYLADQYLSNLLSHRIHARNRSACFPMIECDARTFPRMASVRSEARKKASVASTGVGVFLTANFGLDLTAS